MSDHNKKDQILAEEIEVKQISNKTKANTTDRMIILKNLDYFNGKSRCIYDYQLLENLLDHSAFFKRLKPDAVQRILGKQRKYSYLKKFAIERLEEMIYRQLNLLFNINHCHYSYEEPDEKKIHHIFNWSMEEFLNRRKLQNFVWIDVLLKFPETCLNKYKFRKDLEELKKYVYYIFASISMKIEDEKIDIERQVVKPINNIKLLLKIFDNLEQEFQDNKNNLKELLQYQLVLTTFKRDTEKRLTAILLRAKITNSHIWDSIEKRCYLKCLRSNVNQNQYRNDVIQQSYEIDVENHKKKTLMENVCSNNCMDYFYSAIERLKTAINEIQSKFDVVSEEMENNLSYKRLQIDKLRDQRQWLTKEIKRFHEEIEVMRIRQEREAEERECLRLEEEEFIVKMTEKKQNEGKKGKKLKR